MEYPAFLSASIAAVLACAGAAKLVLGSGIQPFLVALSVPPRLAAIISPAIPILDIGVAVALVAIPGTGSTAAACLLTSSFVAVLLRAALGRSIVLPRRAVHQLAVACVPQLTD